MSGLTPRQWRLYNYLKERDGWTTQCQIALDLKKIYPFDYPFSYDDLTPFHDTQARHDMTDDIRAINESGVIQKIILSSAKGVKLATEEEAMRYIKSRYAAIFRQLERTRKIERKAGLDGQMRIVFGEEREIIQAFTDSNSEGARWRKARLSIGWTQKQAVEQFRKYIPFDTPLLSRVENGVVLPTEQQRTAFERVYNPVVEQE